ncbi:peptidoglycan D,D-transpeptidase FtsI family protein [Butyrivibrio proteoclasticus]|uniref:peptidoglycan D,D-transpeptidase FtsI family protein n=1 Tax=Butyrivibrio proteoclasticus TaxID=43305 RepID=UPI00047DDC4D|nr:penicillin-binding transpeptidase domain-containing protein [Butyrivibrio proteoclasticus]
MREELDRDKGKEKKPKKKIKSYPILVISGFYIVLFAAMLFYIARYSYVNRQTLMNNNYNKRQQILLAQNSRGKILSRNGDVLAYTEEGSDGKDKRVYPYGKEFAHVVGYASNGKAGIEASANYYLINSGAELATKVKFDAEGHKYPGDTVTTTLDVTLQEVAYNALSARKGAIIVSNPKTGEILAMVSKPDFDPNYIAQEWDKMLADDSGDAQLLNRATQGLYPPGSTFKIITALAYLRDNNNDYSGYKYSCNGKFKDGEDVISCYHGENHGGVDFITSFAKSCNTSFANIGLSVSQKTFNQTLEELMFNSELPLSIAYTKSSATYDQDTPRGEIMQLSIGQGTTGMSPIHLNMITCAIANGGVLMKPYLVQSVTTEDKKTVASFEPETYKRLMTKEETDILTSMMVAVVEKGTASKLKGLSYTAAGKTGSAEFNSNSDSHAWFTGFAPADDPEICVTIIVENAGSGGSYAVPIAKRIFDAYFGVE